MTASAFQCSMMFLLLLPVSSYLGDFVETRAVRRLNPSTDQPNGNPVHYSVYPEVLTVTTHQEPMCHTGVFRQRHVHRQPYVSTPSSHDPFALSMGHVLAMPSEPVDPYFAKKKTRTIKTQRVKRRSRQTDVLSQKMGKPPSPQPSSAADTLAGKAPTKESTSTAQSCIDADTIPRNKGPQHRYVPAFAETSSVSTCGEARLNKTKKRRATKENEKHRKQQQNCSPQIVVHKKR